MGRFVQKVIAGMLILFLFSYVGFQAFRYFKSPLKLETVFLYTVSHSLDVEGLVFRDEMILPEQVSGIENRIFDDGERVSEGQVIIEFFPSSVTDHTIKRSREIQDEIAMLSEAQNPTVSNYSNAESINRDIKEQLGTITKMAVSGRFQEVADVRPNLSSLLSKKNISTGKEHSYEGRISDLRDELQAIGGTVLKQDMKTITAPVSGYFVGKVDGLESSLSSKNIIDCSIDDYRNLCTIAKESIDTSNSNGKIVLSQNWYLAALVPKYDIQWLRSGNMVDLYFDDIDKTIGANIYDIKTQESAEDALLIIKSNIVNGDLLKLRDATTVLSFRQYSGLRIETSHIRFQGEERGVYILYKGVIHFKRIDPIYEEAGFVISKQSSEPADSDLVHLYDQIITRGTDLYEGKVI